MPGQRLGLAESLRNYSTTGVLRGRGVHTTITLEWSGSPFPHGAQPFSALHLNLIPHV
jgi:hypothetical protein